MGYSEVPAMKSDDTGQVSFFCNLKALPRKAISGVTMYESQIWRFEKSRLEGLTQKVATTKVKLLLFLGAKRPLTITIVEAPHMNFSKPACFVAL
jgi:hypothetical protein